MPSKANSPAIYLVVLLFVSLISCESKKDVVLRLTIDRSIPNRPVLKGDTNLPDGTILMTSVESPSLALIDEAKVTVRNGKFEAGPFGPEEGLQNGKYLATAVMPPSMFQPDSVRRVIGKQGENLRGPLVAPGKLGVIVSAEIPFQIGN
jgi:hypothetical protein